MKKERKEVTKQPGGERRKQARKKEKMLLFNSFYVSFQVYHLVDQQLL